MAGRKKTVVESTEQEISTKQEVSTDIEDIAVDEAIKELKRLKELENGCISLMKTITIENVGIIVSFRYFDKDNKFVNGDTIFVPGAKQVTIQNENGTFENKLVHINS